MHRPTTELKPGRRLRGASLLAYGLVVGLVAVVALTSVTQIGGSIQTLFGETSDSLAGVAGASGSTGTDEPGPDSFDFTDISDVAVSSLTESDIVEVTGVSSAAISVSGGGGPEFRICSDVACSGEVQGWGGAAQTVQGGEYVQLRLTSSGQANTALTATLSIGSLTAGWSVTTADAPLFSFSSHVFSSCGQTGQSGPSQSACRSEYSTGWDEDDANFLVSGGIQLWTVPETATYRIEARGAQGGTGGGHGSSGARGGGAIIAGDFALTRGEQIKILVGQEGGNTAITHDTYEGGGGGGSFVTTSSNSPLIIAGGGGGASTVSVGQDGSVTNDGTDGNPGDLQNSTSTGGTGGQGGLAGIRPNGSTAGAAGGGLTGDGGDGCCLVTGGAAFVNGGTGGDGQSSFSPSADGGFGGGGGAFGENCCIGGGGGGGYSGGGGGSKQTSGPSMGGGGGGSYNDGTNPSSSTGHQGAGQVSITKL